MTMAPYTLIEGVPIKYLSLLVLTVQNSALILVMRYTRASVPADQLYLASTAVIMNEIVKVIACILLIYYTTQSHQRSVHRLYGFLHQELVVKWRDTMKLSVPAILYLIQNNLQYVAATNLDAATFQVLYQLKILTTAFFSVVILHKNLTRYQWISLVVLTAGIALVVLPKDVSLLSLPSYFMGTGAELSEAQADVQDVGNQSNSQGFFAVLMACILSGLAGVWFEKIVKGKATPPAPIKVVDEESEQNMVVVEEPALEDMRSMLMKVFVQNIQLSMFSVLLGMIFTVILQDGAVIIEKGFFANYNILTWTVIGIQAFGGLVVAVVIKFADNILKGFATSFSIILSSIFSVWLFGFAISGTFLLGAAFVIYATYLYSS